MPTYWIRKAEHTQTRKSVHRFVTLFALMPLAPYLTLCYVLLPVLQYVHFALHETSSRFITKLVEKSPRPAILLRQLSFSVRKIDVAGVCSTQDTAALRTQAYNSLHYARRL